MQEIANFPRSPYYFEDTYEEPIKNPLCIPKPLIMKIFFDLFELGRGSLKSIGALRGTCKFMWNFANTPALWKMIHKSLPLPEYDNCEENDYYNLCKQYNTAAKNVAKGKYWIFEADNISVWTKNILAIRSDKEPNYVCNLFYAKYYKIDEKKFECQGFDKFLIHHKEKELEILDLSSEKTHLLNIENGCVTGDHTFDELSISMPKELMCFEKKLLLSLDYDATLKKIYMKTWDIRTGKCQRTEEILDTSKPQRVEFFCKQLPYIRKEERKRKRGENLLREITIFDSGKERRYSFQLQDNEDVSSRSPHITDSYIVYCGIDNVLTFLNRESEKLTFIDLGDKDKNLMAMCILRGLMRIPNAKIYPRENIFIYYALADNNLEIWDLLTGQQISKGEHRLTSVFESQILIYDELKDCDIFYDLNLQEKFVQEKGCMAMSINERYQIINVPDQYLSDRFLELEKIQIYDTTSNTKIALELPNRVLSLLCGIAPIYQRRMISALWEDFLAIPGRLDTENDEMDYVFIFDIRNGKHLRSIPIQLNSDSDYITDLEWLNGCLRVEHTIEQEEEAEPAFIFIAFQQTNPFPSPNSDKK